MEYSQAALAEKIKYDDVWVRPEYRVKAHAVDLWQNRRDYFPAEFKSVIDFGCGHGRFVSIMDDIGKDSHGVDFDSSYLDPGIRSRIGDRFHAQCLWDLYLDRNFDLGVCTDVMEHIPEEYVNQTFRRIFAYCGKSVFKIANFSSKSLGHDLHPTMKPIEWWVEQIEQAGGVPNLIDRAYPRQGSFIITVGY